MMMPFLKWQITVLVLSLYIIRHISFYTEIVCNQNITITIHNLFILLSTKYFENRFDQLFIRMLLKNKLIQILKHRKRTKYVHFFLTVFTGYTFVTALHPMFLHVLYAYRNCFRFKDKLTELNKSVLSADSRSNNSEINTLQRNVVINLRNNKNQSAEMWSKLPAVKTINETTHHHRPSKRTLSHYNATNLFTEHCVIFILADREGSGRVPQVQVQWQHCHAFCVYRQGKSFFIILHTTVLLYVLI